MKTKHSFLSTLNKRQFLYVSLALFILLVSGSIAYGSSTCTLTCSTKVNHSTTLTVNAYGECRQVTDNSTKGGDLAIPLKKPGEWFSFRITAGDKNASNTAYYTYLKRYGDIPYTPYYLSNGVTVAACPAIPANDVCTKINGVLDPTVQTSVPDNYQRDTSGNCTYIPDNACPVGQFIENGVCTTPDRNECTFDGAGGVWLCWDSTGSGYDGCAHITPRGGNGVVQCP